MTEADLWAVCARLPIFPLPRVVLLPGELLPLHVFEPRYRALVQHVNDGAGLLGIATLRPGYESDYEGTPAIWPEVGVGRIVRTQALPDGRSNVLVRFEGAARVVEELAVDTPFRQVRTELLPAPGPDGYAPGPELRLLALQVAANLGPLGPRERLFSFEGPAWTDAMATLFLTEPDARRAYLVGSGPERQGMVQEALFGLLVGSGGAGEDA